MVLICKLKDGVTLPSFYLYTDQGVHTHRRTLLNVVVIRHRELAAHPGVFKGDMNSVEGGKEWPGADSNGHAQSYGNKTGVHRIAAKPVRAVCHQFAVGR